MGGFGRSGKGSGSSNNLCLAASIGLPCFIVIFAILFGIPISQLIVGSMYKDSCPADYRIPIYLIVAGITGLMPILILSCMFCSKSTAVVCLCVYIIFALFNFGWLIAGSVWVFSIHDKVQYSDPNNRLNYCHNAPYRCAFVTIILQLLSLFSQLCLRGSGQPQTI